LSSVNAAATHAPVSVAHAMPGPQSAAVMHVVSSLPEPVSSPFGLVLEPQAASIRAAANIIVLRIFVSSMPALSARGLRGCVAVQPVESHGGLAMPATAALGRARSCTCAGCCFS
jgi:hypothetical protein